MENRNGRSPGEYRPVSLTDMGGPQRPTGQQRQTSVGGRPPARQPAPPPRQPEKKKKRQRSESRWFRAIVMVIATVGLCAFIALFILQSANDLFGLNQDDLDIEVTIPEDSTLQEISALLAQKGVVEQRLTFQLYASLKKDEKYHGGNYVFNTNMGYDEILRDLRTGKSEKEVVDITFPEGLNIYEIAKLLEEKKVCEADKFLDHMQTADFTYEFMDQLPDDNHRFRRLEGYVFPDTYTFYINENVDSVARKFLSNFNTKITTTMKNRMRDLNMTLDETLALASIIQKETGGINGLDEMKRVSAVFHNRLDLPEVYPNLQSDVTRDYVNYYIKPFLDIKNQAMYDVYNTYACEGLPVGPICNPGAAAIEAALWPFDTENYFFVTTGDGSVFLYADTAQLHYQNIADAASRDSEGDIHGVGTE